MMTVDAPEVTWTRHTFAAMGTVVVVSLPASSDTTTLLGRVETMFGEGGAVLHSVRQRERPDAGQRRPGALPRGGLGVCRDRRCGL